MNYSHLTEEERYHIDELLREGFNQTFIANELGRSKSTLSRELRRNKGERGWRPRQAHFKALTRLQQRGRSNVARVEETSWNYAVEKLVQEQWSPEQISGRLKHENLPSISHESIYQRILADKKSGGSLYSHLRCKKKRKKRYGGKSAGRGCIPNRVDIDMRPKVVDTRKRLGDWEGDTIIGNHTRGAVIATMVERKSRFTVIAKSKDKTSSSVIGSIIDEMKDLESITKTITLDNGKEFSGHQHLSNELGSKVFFAKPYASWERGLNENTNGLIRQYYPKKTSFDTISSEEMRNTARKLNNRPRKCLNFQTPLEVLEKLIKKMGVALRI